MAPPPRQQHASVILGYDSAEYRTTSKTMDEGKNERENNFKRVLGDVNKNKQCHVIFGDPSKKRSFIVSSAQPDPIGEMHHYTAKLSSDAKKMLLKTSSSFGTDTPSYITSAQIATQFNSGAAHEAIILRNEVRKRTGPRPTRGMTYDDEIQYVSESKSQFANKYKEHKPSLMAESVKNDLRATHFTLGNEKIEYKTSSHINKLSPAEFAHYPSSVTPPHDLRKSTVDIS